MTERKMAQPEIGGVRTTEDESEKLETFSDDEEITIPSQDNAEVRNVDIRDEHSENTQREDWLLRTEPWHGARPRQTGAEHPPATKDSTLKNAADIFGTLRLSPGRRVDMKEEVFTPPGGGGGVRSLILWVCKMRHKLCLRLFRRTLLHICRET